MIFPGLHPTPGPWFLERHWSPAKQGARHSQRARPETCPWSPVVVTKVWWIFRCRFIRKFPEIGVPPNHPDLNHFAFTPIVWGTPILGNLYLRLDDYRRVAATKLYIFQSCWTTLAKYPNPIASLFEKQIVEWSPGWSKSGWAKSADIQIYRAHMVLWYPSFLRLLQWLYRSTHV